VVLAALVADPTQSADSDGNGVFEPGETVSIDPSWKNDGGSGLDLTGAASGFSGPIGATYMIVDAAADYGLVGAGATASCATAPDCYKLFASSPATRPQRHWDTTFLETPSASGTPKTWTLHLGDSFADVPRTQLFYKKVEAIFHNNITVGCTGSDYCPAAKTPRSQMAIFVARALAGGGANVPVSGNVGGQPYNCVSGGTSLFTDVQPMDNFCKSVHYIYGQNVTSGCGTGLYCPDDNVTRAEMAMFIARALFVANGGGPVPETYGPDPVTGLSYSCDAAAPDLHFDDVTTSDIYCKHAHYLWARAIVSGCSADEYCPTPDIRRDEMAKFIANAFGLRVYGP
jgi:hypothetical protein